MAQLLRADLLPEAWIAPPPVRALRALLRHRVALARLRTLLRNRIHAVVAEHGHDRPAGCWSGPGRQWLAALELPAVSREVVDDDRGLIDALDAVAGRLDWEIRQRARSDPRVKVLTQLPGIGPFTALVIVAEIGDVSRFASARKLASSATARRRQARSSSPSALTGAHGLRALQHDPGPRGGTNTAAARKASTPIQPDDKEQVTGPAHHALLTNGSPMGG